MFKKIILVLALIGIIILTAYGALSGTYTTNGYFYLPGYGEYGTEAFTTYNAYMQIADTQIEANKTNSFSTINTESELESAITDVSDVLTNTDLTNIYYCNDYANPDDAITAIGATEATLLVTETETCDTNFTVPATMMVKFERGGSFAISNGITVTFNGQIEAGLWQIFALTGTGVVSGDFKQSPVYPEWWGIDGTADDVEINLALTAAGTYGTVLLSPTKTYYTSSVISFTGNRQTLKTAGDGKAIIESTSADDIIKNISFTHIILSNIRIKAADGSSTKTGFRMGDGDTWYSVIRDVDIEGNSILTQGVCIWNDDAGEVRDYFTLFDHVTVRNCRYNWVLGHDMTVGAADVGTAALAEVNRIKLTNCDDYGFIKYGIYMSYGNGHYITGHHFTNSQANAIADIYWDSYYHHVDAVFESGADYAIDFAEGYGYGDITGDFIGYTRKFRFDGVTSTDDYLQVKLNSDSPNISYGSALGKVFASYNLTARNIHPYDDADLYLSVYTGKKLYMRQRVAATSLYGDTIFTFDSDGNQWMKGSLSFEGSTADEFETTFTITDPTADRAITVPDSDQTIGTATSINEDVVDSTALKDDNAPADDDIVSYEATGTTFHYYSRDEVGIKFSKFDATEAPTINNDVDEGYVVGSNWFDVTNDIAYVCIDNTDGAAVWKASAPAGAAGSVGISGTPADNEWARWVNATDVEGLTDLETRNALSMYVVYPQDYAESGDGTVGSPWAGDCINDAYTACPTGGTIYLRAGYYSLTTELEIVKAINIIGEGIGRTFIITGDIDEPLEITADYVTMKGFTVDGDAQTNEAEGTYCIRVYDANYVSLENIEVKESAYYGMSLVGSYNTYTNILAHDNVRHGVHPGNGANNGNQYNTYRDIYAWDNGNSGFNDSGGSKGGALNNIYDNLRCWDNASHGIALDYLKGGTLVNSWSQNNGGVGLHFMHSYDTIIENFFVYFNDDDGIYLKYCDDITFTNVISKSNGTDTITSDAGIQILDCPRTYITSCQFYDEIIVFGTDIAFVDGGGGEDTITQTAARFLIDGLSAGDDITITGATEAGNNDTFTIVSVVAGTINVATGSLTAEAAGASIVITGEMVQDRGIYTEASALTDYIEITNCRTQPNKDAGHDSRIKNTAGASIKGYDSHTLDRDHDYNGKWGTGVVGETVVFGDLLYFDWTATEWKETDADAAGTMPGLRIALESKADGETCLMLIEGEIRDDSAWEFAGSILYASVTLNHIESTAPSGSGDQVQRVGVASTADVFYFDPSLDVGEI